MKRSVVHPNKSHGPFLKSYNISRDRFNRDLAQQRGVSKWESWIALKAMLMQPATILIDHAHFQYNTVMLGFVVASMSSLLSDRYM